MPERKVTPIPLWKQVIRFIIHVPVGMVTVLFLMSDMPGMVQLAWGVYIGFAIYEIVEDFRIGDRAHIDFRGWLAGIVGMGLYYYRRG